MAEINEELPRDDLVRAVHPGFELRASENANGMPTLVSRFIQYDTFTEIDSAYEGHFMERIAPGALKKTLAENRDQIKVLLEHGQDPTVGNKPLGAISEIRDQGGYAVGIVPLLDTSYVRDLVPALERDLYGSSFRFRVVKEDIVRDPERSALNPDGIPERTITELRLYEFGPVLFPAYEGATAGVRSLTDRFHAVPVTINIHEGVRAAMPSGMSMMPDGVTACTSAGQPGYKGDTACHTHDGSEADMKAAMAKAMADAGRSQEIISEPAVATPDEHDDTATAAVEEDEQRDDEPEHSPESRSTPEPDTSHTSEQKEPRKMEHAFRTVEEIDARLVEIASTQNELSAEWGVRAFDPDTQTKWDELIEEKEQLTLDRGAYLERKAYLEVQVKAGHVERGAGSPGVVAKRNAAPENPFDLAEYHTRSTSQEHMSRLYDEGAHRAIEGFRYPNHKIDQAQASEAVEQLLNQDGPDKEVAQRLLVHGSPTYRSAFWKTLARQQLSPEEQRKMHEGQMLELRALTAAGDGGITVPVQIDPTVLLSSTGAINPFRQVARLVRTTSYQWQGVTSTGITAQYRAEGAVMTDNSPALVAPTITPHRADAFVPYTWEAAQDWGSLEGEMASLFADAKDIVEATKFAVGAGDGQNEPLGILTAAGTVVGTAGTVTVGTVDIYALENALPVRFQPNASWLATPALFSRIRQQSGGQNTGIWADSLQAGMPARLLGYPAYKASTVGTAGGVVVPTASVKWGIFGDFNFYAIVDRIGFQVRPIENLFNGNTAGGIAYPNGMSGLVAYWRNSAGALSSNAFRVGTVT